MKIDGGKYYKNDMINIAESQNIFDSLTARPTDQISYIMVALWPRESSHKKLAVNIRLKIHVIS